MADENRVRFFALIERYNRLGDLLPEHDLDGGNVEQVAETRLILSEMNATRTAMDRGLDAEWKSREIRPALKVVGQ